MTDEQDTQDEQESPEAGADGGDEETAKAKEKMEELEQDPPENLEDWPKDKAMYETFGGPEGDHSYEEGPEQKLGPSGLRHHEGGDVSVDGEEVDDPDEYKGDPIPGGPTDPDAPKTMGEETKDEKEDGGDSGEG